MKGFRLSRGRAIAASVVLAVALGGVALLWKRPSPHSAPAPAAVSSQGEKVFNKWCSDCHSTAAGPGSLALQRKYKGEVPAVLAQRNDLTPEFIEPVVRQGMSFMPSFRKTEISDADLALLAAYLASTQGRDEAVPNKASGE